MRGLLKLLSLASQDWTSSLWLLVGICFVLAQIVVLRKRYLYIGCLGVGCVATAVRRVAGEDATLQMSMLAAQALGFGYGAVLMVMHSRDNMARTRNEIEGQRQRLYQEMQELVARARPQGDPQGSTGTEEASARSEGAGTDGEETT
jgi:hypothetical protein